MNPSVKQYRIKLKKHLHCTNVVKNRLLTKFDNSLGLYLEETPSPNEQALYAAFGTPENMASILMNEVTSSESTNYRRKKRLLKLIICALVSVFLLLGIYIYFIKQNPVIVYDGIYDDGTLPTHTNNSFAEDGIYDDGIIQVDE